MLKSKTQYNLLSPFVLWFTGLSGSGKTTLSQMVYDKLITNNISRLELFDGDDLRTNLTKRLGFSK